uniref:uncharacterized protein LOC122600464 n=1 Tax=Erigeron canadensis TaxID=72917 RepID=UPI001CB938A4|nr:uncharacterized protein LOC122600464 [Erigeron canadensis]
MGKKGSSNKAAAAASRPHMSVTIKEALTGKKHINAKSSLKLQHLKDLAVWASHDAAIPPLGAFFGHHFAAASEALTAPVDPSLLTCQRCETILHPGYNCTIRIEKSKRSTRCKGKGKEPACYSQNNIVYTCHFCSHRNMKRGTQRTSLPKVKAHQKSTNRKTGCTGISSNFPKDDVIAPLAPMVDNTFKGQNMGIVGISETSEVNDDINSTAAPHLSSAEPCKDDMNSTAARLSPSADASYTGKTMGTVEIIETLEVKNDSADMSSLTSPLGSTTVDPMDKMGIVEINEPLEVKDESANINTLSAPLRSSLDNSRDIKGLAEINKTLVVQNNNAVFSPTTPSSRPALTPLELKKKRDRSKAKKKVASGSTHEGANAENSLSKSKRRRRKSWTSLKEIAKKNEIENSKRLMNSRMF